MVKKKIEDFYQTIYRGIELLKKKQFNSLYILGKAGVGKSFAVDEAIKKYKVDARVFSGKMSEVMFFEFIKENYDKVIIFRDTSELLRNLSSINTLKILTEQKPVRIISRRVKGNEMTIKFTGKIIIELNSLTNRYKEDLGALLSRGLFISLNFSEEDIKNIMYLISQNKEERMVTYFLLKNKQLINYDLNLRLQDKCFRLFKASQKDKRLWKSDIMMYLNTQVSEPKKLLYKCAGNKPITRNNFVRFLMREKGWSRVTSQRRIKDWLFIKDIYSNGLLKRASLSLQKPSLISVRQIIKKRCSNE